ncbi:UNVERIFIED_CONTAM: hypothetical protein K2H54_057191 [Gekko kuhli]
MRRAISAEERIAITLWWLVGMNCYREVSNQNCYREHFSKMEPQQLGVYWMDEEVELLFRTLHKEEAGRRVMASTHVETLGLFSRVAEVLPQAGYPRSGIQC